MKPNFQKRRETTKEFEVPNDVDLTDFNNVKRLDFFMITEHRRGKDFTPNQLCLKISDNGKYLVWRNGDIYVRQVPNGISLTNVMVIPMGNFGAVTDDIRRNREVFDGSFMIASEDLIGDFRRYKHNKKLEFESKQIQAQQSEVKKEATQFQALKNIEIKKPDYELTLVKEKNTYKVYLDYGKGEAIGQFKVNAKTNKINIINAAKLELQTYLEESEIDTADFDKLNIQVEIYEPETEGLSN